MSTTPNMNLDLPSVSQTLGPQWATLLNAALTLLDSHDHTSGKGVPIPTAGISLDADLSFNNLNATDLRSARFALQSDVLEDVTDLGCIVNVNGDLYWNNGGGTPVQITDGDALSATSLGGISGLPSGSASAAFAASTFTWRQATNRAAVMDAGPVVIRDTVENALGVTLRSPVGLAGAYNLTLPGALPGAGTKFLRVNSAGTLSCDVEVDSSSLEISGSTLRVKVGGISTDKIASQAVTRPKLTPVGQQFSSATPSPFWVTTSTSYVNVENLSVVIETTGRPVVVACVAADGSSGHWDVSGSGSVGANLRLDVSGDLSATIAETALGGGSFVSYPGAVFWHLFVPAAGLYVLQVQAKVDAGSTLSVFGLKLVAYEL